MGVVAEFTPSRLAPLRINGKMLVLNRGEATLPQLSTLPCALRDFRMVARGEPSG